MRSGGRLIERYIIAAALPYILMAAFLLTAVLLAQQSGRVAEILVVARVPRELLAEFALALIPNVLVFTLPMATLVGTLVGLSRMGTDSELVALRAAGVGTWRMLWPILLLGFLLTILALWINVWGAPEAARTLRRTAVRVALYKLDSPVDPRTFNTEIQGYVIYVKDGDQAKGQWGRVFLYAQEKDGGTRLVTARSGRIDSSAEQSELVLSDAVLTRLPSAANPEAAYVTERLEQLRVVLDTGRRKLMEGLNKEEARPEEMDLRALFADTTGSLQQRTDRLTLAHRRLALSMGPLIFALLGASLGLRVRKGGRGMGLLLSLAVLIIYYLIGLFGEQMARAGTVRVFVGVWTASVLTVLCALALLFLRGRRLFPQFPGGARRAGAGSNAEAPKSYAGVQKAMARALLPGFPGLLDKTVIRLLSFSFIVVFAALTAIILIFTLFELWRSIIERGVGGRTVAQYLLYLLPFVSVQLTAPSMLVAVLATYALMARRSEAVAWWACGQSVFRLALPGLFVALCAGFGTWMVQERLMPEANLRQDALRAQIRTGSARAATQAGRFWLASNETGRLYAYESEGAGETIREVSVYEFDKEGVHLVRVVRAERGGWNAPGRMVLGEAQVIDLQGAGGMRRESVELLRLEPGDGMELFKPWTDKPSQLSAKELSAYISTISRKGGAVAPLMVALQRKYAEPLGAVVMALIGIPLALAFGRRSAVAALSSAVAVGLAFWGMTSGAQQLGSYGLLPPAVAAWAPIVIFGAMGTYLLARSRT